MNWQPIRTCPETVLVLMYAPTNPTGHSQRTFIGRRRIGAHPSGMYESASWIGGELRELTINASYWAELPEPLEKDVP